MGDGGTKGVVPAKTGDDGEFRMIALVGTHTRNLVPVQVLAHDHRCEAIDSVFVDPIMERSRPADSEIRNKENGLIEVAGLVGKEEKIPGRKVVGQDLAAAVVDSAPDSGQGKTAKTVVLGHLTPVGALDELELGPVIQTIAPDRYNVIALV